MEVTDFSRIIFSEHRSHNHGFCAEERHGCPALILGHDIHWKMVMKFSCVGVIECSNPGSLLCVEGLNRTAGATPQPGVGNT